MSYEAAMKHYPKDMPKPTREEWEASLKRLEGLGDQLQVPLQIPRMATGAVIPFGAELNILKDELEDARREREAEVEERRHQELLEAIKAVAKGRDKQAQTKKGPSPETRERFRMFKAMKDAHPEYSYEKVAMEISFRCNKNYTREDVRNAYRALGEKWVRADKIR